MFYFMLRIDFFIHNPLRHHTRALLKKITIYPAKNKKRSQNSIPSVLSPILILLIRAIYHAHRLNIAQYPQAVDAVIARTISS